jgi:hypothetical protein
MSWAEVDRHEPVTGAASEFDRVASRWRTASDTSRSLALTFQGIVSDTGTMRFEGRTADAFQAIVKESADVLDDMPRVCSDVAWVLAEHARAVRQLHQEADAALARARTAWHDQRRSSTAANDASGRAEHIRRQIRSLQCYPPEQVSSQMQRLNYNLSIEQRAVSNHKWNAETAARRLNQEYQNRDGYERREESINRQTAQALRNLDLRSLKDPTGAWHTLVRAVEFVLALPQVVARELVTAIGEGVLWELRAALDTIGNVLSGLMVVVAVATALCPYVAPALVAVAVMAASVAVIKATTTLVLFAAGSADPASGRRLNRLDLGMDFIGAALAFTGARSTAVVANTALRNMGPGLVRGWIAQNRIGLEVARRLRNEVIKDVLRYDVPLVIGSEVYDRVATPPRGAPLARQTAAVRRADRGLSSSCRPVLASAGGGW